MRKIKTKIITKAVGELCTQANQNLRGDVLAALKAAYVNENNVIGKKILAALIENAAIAYREKLPLCQDTGLAVVFVELGQDVHLLGGDLNKAINQGVALGYKKGYLRSSVIDNPLRRGKSTNAPAVVHINLVRGNRIKITVLPKGFGCENVGQVKMFRPTESLEKIKEFIINVVKAAGPNACPPYIVGVGIGGTQDYACLLAKKALLRKLDVGRRTLNTELELSLLKEINNLNLGPMGLGGKMTALAVNILTYPTHIAGLPVAVNISCHSLRSATATI